MQGDHGVDDQLTLMNSRAVDLLAGDRERWPLAGDQAAIGVRSKGSASPNTRTAAQRLSTVPLPDPLGLLHPHPARVRQLRQLLSQGLPPPPNTGGEAYQSLPGGARRRGPELKFP